MLSFHTLALSMIDWKVRKWKITWYNKLWLTISFVALNLYLIMIITMSDYFTYSGASAVFLGFAYVPIWYIHYRIDNFRNRVSFDSYIEWMDSTIHSKPSTGKILKDTIEISDNVDFLWCKSRGTSNTHLLYILNIWIIIAYAFALKERAPPEHKNLGFINMGVIIVSDLILILWELLQSKTGNYLSPFKVNLIILLTRSLFWFNRDYWVITHCIAFLLLSMLFSTVFVMKHVYTKNITSLEEKTEKDLLENIYKWVNLRLDLYDKITGIDPNDLTVTQNNKWKHIIIDLIPICLMFISFLIYGNIIWEQDIPGAVAQDIYIGGEKVNQEIFLSFSTTIFINFSVMIGWLRHFQLNDFKIRWWTLLLSIITFIIMFIVGVTRELTDMDDISLKVRIISLVLFIVIPLYIFSIWIFYGIWRSNKFNLFSQHYNHKFWWRP